jgi:hypothetical protein
MQSSVGNKLTKTLLALLLAYPLLWATTMLVSMHAVDESFKVTALQELRSKQCPTKPYGNKKPFNPLFFWNFYLDYEFWSAELRLDSEILNDERCLSVLESILHKHPGKITVLIFDKDALLIKKMRNN